MWTMGPSQMSRTRKGAQAGVDAPCRMGWGLSLFHQEILRPPSCIPDSQSYMSVDGHSPDPICHVCARDAPPHPGCLLQVGPAQELGRVHFRFQHGPAASGLSSAFQGPCILSLLTRRSLRLLAVIVCPEQTRPAQGAHGWSCVCPCVLAGFPGQSVTSRAGQEESEFWCKVAGLGRR